MKCFLKVLLLGLLILPIIVHAENRFEYRTNPSKGKTITINGNKVHASLEIQFNINSNGEPESSEFIDNYDLSYKDDTFNAVIKRSEINKLFQNKDYDNVKNQINLWIDYIDTNNGKRYYEFRQNYYDKPELYMTKGTELQTYNEYGLIEMITGSVFLSGTNNQAYGSWGGEYILFEAENDPIYESYPAKYNKDQIDFTKDKILFDFPKSRFSMQVIEDVQMDLGNVKTVVKDPTINNETGEIVYDNTEEVNNYYAEYIDQNKLSYSWTMYDKDGNPIELNNDTMIKIDDEETQEEMFKSLKEEMGFLGEYKDHIKILSFEHDGDLNGKAVIKLYVGDKFNPGEYLTLYYYNPDKNQLEYVNDNLSEEELEKIWEDSLDSYDILVNEEGYIEFELTHCSDYILVDNEVKEEIKKSANNEELMNQDNKKAVPYVVGGAVLLVIIVAGVVIFNKKKAKKDIIVEEKEQ